MMATQIGRTILLLPISCVKKDCLQLRLSNYITLSNLAFCFRSRWSKMPALCLVLTHTHLHRLSMLLIQPTDSPECSLKHSKTSQSQVSHCDPLIHPPTITSPLVNAPLFHNLSNLPCHRPTFRRTSTSPQLPCFSLLLRSNKSMHCSVV